MSGILIVEDDPLTAGAIARLVRSCPARGPLRVGVLTARSATMAEALLARPDIRLSGVILDVRLPDGDGLTLLETHIDRLDTVATLVLTGAAYDAETSRRAYLLNVPLVSKPVDPRVIRRFVARAATGRLEPEPVDVILQRWIRRYALTTRQSQLLASAVAGHPPEVFRETVGIGKDRYKELVGEVLAKTQCRNVGHLVGTLLRETHEPAR